MIDVEIVTVRSNANHLRSELRRNWCNATNTKIRGSITKVSLEENDRYCYSQTPVDENTLLAIISAHDLNAGTKFGSGHKLLSSQRQGYSQR